MSSNNSDKQEDSPTKKVSQVMNNDILMEIMLYLDCHQIKRLERVSKQFRQCGQYVTQHKIEAIAINDFICLEYNRYLANKPIIYPIYKIPTNCFNRTDSEGFTFEDNEDTIVRLSEQFPKVRYISLAKYTPNYQKFVSFVNLFQHLDTLFIGCNTVEFTRYEFKQLGQLLSSRLKRFYYICDKQSPNVIKCIKNLTQLETLLITLETKNCIIQLFKLLPSSVQFLHIHTPCNRSIRFDEQLAQFLVDSRAKNIDTLYITPQFNAPALEIIGQQMNLKTFLFSSLIETNQWKSLEELAKNQKNLTYLGLKYHWFLNYRNTDKKISFPKVETLLLHFCCMDVLVFEGLLKSFQSMKTLILRKTAIRCIIDQRQHLEFSDCNTCFRHFYELVAKHTTIRKLVVHFEDLKDRTEVFCQTLNLMKYLRKIHLIRFCYDDHIDYYLLCQQLISDYIHYCHHNSDHKLFTFVIHNDIYLKIKSEIPRNIRILYNLYF
ncbi:uncharacterized protein LOC128966295 [Oppia nitens]|uniref:uncharacterized protein LOC128966295 n=1 Tax=Oppia nitens TaxID=1686743 RepID=UPI0023DA087F|nr:uncharacterized protein LOC128966295 [Oppia nitens]